MHHERGIYGVFDVWNVNANLHEIDVVCCGGDCVEGDNLSTIISFSTKIKIWMIIIS